MKGDFTWPIWWHPEIRVAGRFRFTPKLAEITYLHPTFAIHQHNYEGTITLQGKAYSIVPGDVTFSPPHMPSKYELKESGYHWCIHFHPVTAVNSEQLRLPPHLHLPDQAALISERFRAIAEIWGEPRGSRKKEPLVEASAGTLLQGLLLLLAIKRRTRDRRPGPSRRSDEQLEAIRVRLDREYPQKLEVDELARSSGLSRNYFAARFRERFGQTVQSYLLHRRIEMARNLLLSTSLSVKEIAFECGIRDPQYFNKQFRRLNGVSPVGFRAQSREV